MKLKFAALSALVAITALPSAVQAEDAPSTTFNVGVVSDYRYRGISQSGLKPALQGGIDYSNPNGLYLGTWLSTIKWIKDAGKLVTPNVDSGNTPAEWDLYGGYKGEITKELTYDVGGLYYLYVNNKTGNVPASLAGPKGANANTFELYGALTFGPITAKYSHSLTDTFGYGKSKNSGYLDVTATFDLGSGFSLAPHVGHQTIKSSNPSAAYTDYSLTLSKDLGSGFSVTAAAVGTDADKTVYLRPDGKFTGKSALVVGAKYSF